MSLCPSLVNGICMVWIFNAAALKAFPARDRVVVKLFHFIQKRVKTFNFREMRSSRFSEAAQKMMEQKEIKIVVCSEVFQKINGSRKLGNKGAHCKKRRRWSELLFIYFSLPTPYNRMLSSRFSHVGWGWWVLDLPRGCREGFVVLLCSVTLMKFAYISLGKFVYFFARFHAYTHLT